jgi:hypothetical protein
VPETGEQHKSSRRKILSKSIKYACTTFLMLGMLSVPDALCSRQSQMSYPISKDTLFYVSPPKKASRPQGAVEQDRPQRPGTTNPNTLQVTPFHNHIMQAAAIYDVDPALIQAIIMVESSFNPQAVSKKGAQGLMQLMPATAKSLGIHDSFDPGPNIDAGVRYFRRLLDRFEGDVHLSLAAYNAGPRHVRVYNGIPPFRETREYIEKVLHYQNVFRVTEEHRETYQTSLAWG